MSSAFQTLQQIRAERCGVLAPVSEAMGLA